MQSRITAYVATSFFNLAITTLMLIITHSAINHRATATVIAYTLATIFAMIFTLDVWWARVSGKIRQKIPLESRAMFVATAVTATLLSVVFVSLLSHDDSSLLEVLVINWLLLFAISLLKFVWLDKAIR